MQHSIIDTTHISTVVNLSHAQAGPSNLLSSLSTQPRSGFKYMHVHDYVQVYMYTIITEADVNIKESN